MNDNNANGDRAPSTASTSTATTPRTGASTTRAPATTSSRDLPRRRAGLRARDQGDQEALGHGRLRLQQERPHGGERCCERPAHAARLTSRAYATTTDTAIADGTTPAASGNPAIAVRPRHRRRALHHQRRPDRRRLRDGHPRLHARGLDEADIPVAGFEFQDVEADIQAEFLRHKEFVLDLARSAPTTRRTRSRTSATPENFYVETFADSYGDPQDVQVVARSARRRQAALPDQRRRGQDGPTSEFLGGERFDEAGLYYHRLRGTVTGTSPGDEVEVWFDGGKPWKSTRSPTGRGPRPARGADPGAENYTGRPSRTTRTRPARPI